MKEQLRSLRIDRGAEPRPAPRAPRRRAALSFLGAVLALGAGVWLWRFAFTKDPAVTLVRARVERGDRPITGPVLSGSGYLITAEKYIAIGVRVPGRIDRFFVDEGDRVKAGDLLARLDDRDYRAQAGKAEASLRLALANRKLALSDRLRIRTLFEEGIASRQELEQAENRFEVAAATVAQSENEVAQAKASLDDTRLRSPVDGVVLAKLRGVGEIAVPGGFAGSGDLLRVADVSEIRAEVDVSEADLGNLHADQAAVVVPDAYPQSRYDARVVKIYPQVNRQKGTLKVEVRIEKPDARLLPDMSVRVTFLALPRPSRGKDAPPTLLIPRAAVRQGREGAYVWTFEDGRVSRRRVETEPEIGAEVPVTSGLTGSESLVVGSEAELRDGRAVTPANPT